MNESKVKTSDQKEISDQVKAIRISSRLKKKVPITKSADFLW